MTEKPIIFNSEIIKALLDGRKTMTRRVIKPQIQSPKDGAYFDNYNHGTQWNWWSKDHKQFLNADIIRCPYGQIGDGLWVRETWRVHKDYDTLRPSTIFLAMGGDTAHCVCYKNDDRRDYGEDFWGRWRSPIFMPRWASRFDRSITDIRVERVQEITWNDMKAEGIEILPGSYNDPDNAYYSMREEFNNLWDSINGKKEGCSWSDNPWVWVVEFEVKK